jgi:diaminopimelate decarboxylase (EC 4.1.1.20)
VKLPPHLTVKGGHLHIGSQDCVALAAKYGTPLYVTSEDRICEHFTAYHAALSKRYEKVQVLLRQRQTGTSR